MIDCEIWIAMSEDGEWVVVTDESDALSELSDNHGGCAARVVKVTVKMKPPVLAEVEVTVLDDAGELSAAA